MSYRVTFNRPFQTGKELKYLEQALRNQHLSGNGPFTKQCHALLAEQLRAGKVLLTHSATGALEMAALLIDLQPGDEVILPSFTFVSTANAVVLRGATPVFVDIRPDTLNLDENLLGTALSPRTRAVLPVHYAGVSCAMTEINRFASEHGLAVIEDAAQGLAAKYRDTPLGTLGSLGAISFHETKNAISGEGGALVITDSAYEARAEILWEKGTDRSRFFRGEVDKYTWQDVGSSFLPSDLLAAFLLAQLEELDAITQERLRVWDLYHERLAELEGRGELARPTVPVECDQNGHMYYVLLRSGDRRDEAIVELAQRGVQAVFHYVPLHNTPAGRRFGRVAGSLEVTEGAARRLIRLPLWVGMGEREVDFVVEALAASLSLR